MMRDEGLGLNPSSSRGDKESQLTAFSVQYPAQNEKHWWHHFWASLAELRLLFAPFLVWCLLEPVGGVLHELEALLPVFLFPAFECFEVGLFHGFASRRVCGG